MKKLFIILFVLESFSCTRAEKDAFTKVTISIPDHLTASIGNAPSSAMAASISEKINPGGTITAAALNEINCLVVFVSGPEADLQKNECRAKKDSSKFKVGYFIGGLPLQNQKGVATSIDVDIRSGKSRALQLIGFKVITNAASGTAAAETICREFKNNKTYQSFVSDPYILARATGLDLSGGTVNVNLSATFDATQQIDGCMGPDFVNVYDDNDTSTAPAKYAILLQDNVGQSSTPLRENSCVGVKFQVQDRSGRPAQMGSIVYSAKIPQADRFGSFFQPNATKNCGGTLLNSAVGDVPITFNGFNDVVYFFAPALPGGNSLRQIVATDSGASGVSGPLQSAQLDYNFLAGTTTPVKYAVYDLMLNTSTATGSAQKNIVTKNVCRRASVQVVDANGVPLSFHKNSATYQPLTVTGPAPAGSAVSGLSFFANAYCSGNELQSATLAVDSAGSFTDLSFSYMATTSIRQFSFSVNTTGAGINYLPSGDLTDGVNVWGTQD